MEIDSSSISLFALVAAACALADLLVSTKEKEAIKIVLLRGWFLLDKADPHCIGGRTANSILDAFDQIYGVRHFTWRCFRMSALLSVVFILLVAFSFSSQIDQYYLNRPSFKYVVASSVLVATIFNIPGDYFFLLKARWILSHARRVKPRFHPFLLLADVLASYALIAFTVVVLGLAAYLGKFMPASIYSASSWDILTAGAKMAFVYPVLSVNSLIAGDNTQIGVPVFALSIFSAFATSFIFALYNAAALLITTLAFFRVRLMHLIENVFESKVLFTTIGLVLSAAIFLTKSILS